MNKFNKVSFEEMLKHEGLIACEHELLIEDLNKQPMMFASLLAKLGLSYSDIEIKEIFLNCTWYNITREKAKVINFNDYLKDETDDICCQEFISEFDEIIEDEINNIFDKIDKKVEDLLGNSNISSLADIEKVLSSYISECVNNKDNDVLDTDKYIIELNKPICQNISKEELDKCLDIYIKSNSKVYMIYGENTVVLGDIISHSDDKVKVEVVDNECIFNKLKHANKNIEFAIVENSNKTFSISLAYIHSDEKYINLTIDDRISLPKDELKMLLDNYIEDGGKIYLETFGELGTIIDYNTGVSEIKIRLTDNKNIINKFNSYKGIDLKACIVIPMYMSKKMIGTVFATSSL